SPTTCISTASEMVSRIPRRTIAWSSHKITLIIRQLSKDRDAPVAHRQGDRKNDRRATWRGTDVEPAAYLSGSLTQTQKAKRTALALRVQLHTRPVVAHLQRQHAFAVIEIDLDQTGLRRVFDDIGQRL